MEDQEQTSRKRPCRPHSGDSLSDSPEVKRIKENLLDFFDDSDADTVAPDLDLLMKSFQDEISANPPVIDLTSDSGESQPELGYLLEASDDELGLPPSSSITSCSDGVKNGVDELARVESGDSVGIGGFWGFEDQMPSYDDSLVLGTVENRNSEYVAFDDRLFEYSDVCLDSSEFSEFSWRLGSMPAES